MSDALATPSLAGSGTGTGSGAGPGPGERAKRWLGARLSTFRRTPALWALAAITLLGILLRAFFLYRYRPALLGFPDSVVYVIDAHQGLFADSLRVSGYALFLRLLHAISPHLILVTIAQHGLGLASGLLLFDAVRRAGAPIGLGLVPAAVVMLGGSELMLEHALLSDSLFIFFVDLSLWLVVRAWAGSAWWALGVGLSMGCATIDRTVGLELLPFMLACLLLGPARWLHTRRAAGAEASPAMAGWPDAAGAQGVTGSAGSTGTAGPPAATAAVASPDATGAAAAPGSAEPSDGASRFARLRRLRKQHPVAAWRLGAVLAGVVGAVLVIFPFMYAHKQDTGRGYGFASASDFDLYGRVAPWAECSKFTPPRGTEKLCIHMPVSERQGVNAWEFVGSSPAVQVYGIPEWFGPPPQKEENNQLRSFAIAAIEGQPLTYLHYVGRELVRVIDPTFPSSPYKKIGNAGYGETPEGLLNYYFNTSNLANIELIINSYYHSPGVLEGNVDILKSWDRDTRIEGPLMVVVLILALLAPILARGGNRRLAILFGLVSALLILGPILVTQYDWRYMVPVFGPLTATAAIGGYEVWRRLRRVVRKSRSPAI